MKKLLLTLAVAIGSIFAVDAAKVAASFPGGEAAQQEYIIANLKYPQTAKDNGIEGVVGVLFTVKTDGSIGNIKIKRMVDPDLEAESIRLVKSMPAWVPASNDGIAVESTAEIDIPFTLE